MWHIIVKVRILNWGQGHLFRRLHATLAGRWSIIHEQENYCCDLTGTTGPVLASIYKRYARPNRLPAAAK
jgi:hypothetical protein